jgi:hypothetical protein
MQINKCNATQKLNETTHMIILIDVEKDFAKIQCSFMLKQWNLGLDHTPTYKGHI